MSRCICLESRVPEGRNKSEARIVGTILCKEMSFLIFLMQLWNIFSLGGKLGHFPICDWLSHHWIHQTAAKCNFLWLGWRDDWCSFEDNATVTRGETMIPWKIPGNGLVDQHKLPCNCGIAGRKLSSDWGFMLIASRQWLPAYQFRWAQYSNKRHESGSSMANESAPSENWLFVHIPLA